MFLSKKSIILPALSLALIAAPIFAGNSESQANQSENRAVVQPHVPQAQPIPQFQFTPLQLRLQRYEQAVHNNLHYFPAIGIALGGIISTIVVCEKPNLTFSNRLTEIATASITGGFIGLFQAGLLKVLGND